MPGLLQLTALTELHLPGSEVDDHVDTQVGRQVDTCSSMSKHYYKHYLPFNDRIKSYLLPFLCYCSLCKPRVHAADYAADVQYQVQ